MCGAVDKSREELCQGADEILWVAGAGKLERLPCCDGG